MTRGGRTVVGGLVGLAAALGAGGLWIALAPENGFADLAAAAVTRVVLVPAGLLVGALVGNRTSRRPH